jgi:hypothetical protein
MPKTTTCWICSIRDISDDYEYSYNCVSKKAALRQAILEMSGYIKEDYTRKGTKDLAKLIIQKKYDEVVKFWNSKIVSDIVFDISEAELLTNTNIDDIFSADDFTMMLDVEIP